MKWRSLSLSALFALAMGLPSLAQEKNPSRLEILEKQFEARINAEVIQPHQAAVEELNKKYLASLERVQQSAQKDARLDEALAAANEIERVKKGGADAVREDPKTPPSVRNLQSIYRSTTARLNAERDNKLRQVNEGYARALDELVASLTKEGKLEEAKSAREKIIQIKGLAPPMIAVSTPLQEFLVGTKWWWNGSKSWELTFKRDGTVDQPDWTRKGLVTGWRVTNPREVRLTILKGRTTNKTAQLVFADDRESFTGIDFGGKHAVAKSERIKEPEAVVATKPESAAPAAAKPEAPGEAKPAAAGKNKPPAGEGRP